MKTLNNELRLLNKNDEVLCKLSTVTYYDETNEFDEGETLYINPLTGSECQTIDLCFKGWSEQNEEDNNNWNALIKKVRNDAELSQKLFNMNSIIYYV